MHYNEPLPAPRAIHSGSLSADGPPTYGSLEDALLDLRDAQMTLCALGVYLSEHPRGAISGAFVTAAFSCLEHVAEILPVPKWHG